MANLENGFDAEQVAPDKGYDLIPVRKYECIVTQSDVKSTKAGNGSYIWLEVTICDGGQYHGRKIFPTITLTNPNEKAVAIGQGQLSALCHAVGKLKINDTAELHDIPFIADVRIEKDKTGQYSDKNKINAYLKLGEQHAAKPAGNGAAPARQPAMAGAGSGSNGGGKPPWVKK